MRHLLSLFVTVLSFSAFAQSPNRSGDYSYEWDNFRNGFSTSGPAAKWFYFSAGPFVGNGGIETTGPEGLQVRANGTNPRTGEPAYTNTVAPESQSGLPGGIDHVKWLAYMNHFASSGYPGFDAEDGKVLSCEGVVGGRTYGTAQHPFGTIIDNPNDDLRLASFALNSIDFETFMVFDFFISNETVYAFYERLPFGRGPVLGNYAAFSHSVPVLHRRSLDEKYRLRISYDKQRGTVQWFLNDRKVMEVSRLGFKLDPSKVTLDHGGTEGLVAPRQLDCGIGLFTLLDAYRPSDLGLVRISENPNFYFDPNVGQPTPEAFFDDHSAPGNRLWGQGAEMTVDHYRISSEQRRGHGDEDGD